MGRRMRDLRRAVSVYHDQPLYTEHARAAMRRDFSWTDPVAQYASVYRRALAAC